ncbi:MAG: MFS transporter [Planctomycetes bacterium]|nr:MFS transporter [Planctomycetota bacterium]
MTEAKPGFLAQIKSYPSTFWVANTMEIFERMAWYGFYAVAALYLTGPVETGGLGFSSVERGQILAIVPFFLYIFPVITGALADRYGYKRMFIIAFAGMIVSYYLLGQAKTVPTFLLVFMLVAVAAAIFKPVVVGTVARVTNEGNSSTGFGIFYMMVNIGGFFGPLLAGAVRGLSWSYVFIACSAWAAINLVIVLLFYKDPTTEAGSRGARTFRKVIDDAVEVLGNLRFFIAVFVVLISLMIPGFQFPWFGWPQCWLFIGCWLLANVVWDLMLAKGSGISVSAGGTRRFPLLKRMHCSNWRFALFLLILSGFWTSFHQIFLSLPVYIRDYTDTRRMVDLGRAVFPGIDWLAAIEETQLLGEFDRLARQARALEPMAKEDSAEPPAPRGAEQVAALAGSWGLTDESLARLDELAVRLSAFGAKTPITAGDLMESARVMLQYKVRIQPEELGELLAAVPAAPQEITDEQVAVAVATVSKRLKEKGGGEFAGAERDELEDALRGLMSAGPFPAAAALEEACARLSRAERKILPEDLALGVRDLAYRSVIWARVDAGRQVNAEHIINFDAGAIVLFQVLISFLMARFHRFTTMIIGMLVAALGNVLYAVAGGTMLGPVGGLLWVVIAGILIFGVGGMMASPTSQEYVGRIAPRDKVATYMGYYFVAMALGHLFGGLLSGEMYARFAEKAGRPDLMWLFFGGLMAATAVIFVLYDRFVLPRKSTHEQAG